MTQDSLQTTQDSLQTTQDSLQMTQDSLQTNCLKMKELTESLTQMSSAGGRRCRVMLRLCAPNE